VAERAEQVTGIALIVPGGYRSTEQLVAVQGRGLLIRRPSPDAGTAFPAH
jgi:hypothetical protein